MTLSKYFDVLSYRVTLSKDFDILYLWRSRVGTVKRRVKVYISLIKDGGGCGFYVTLVLWPGIVNRHLYLKRPEVRLRTNSSLTVSKVFRPSDSLIHIVTSYEDERLDSTYTKRLYMTFILYVKIYVYKWLIGILHL